MVEVLTDTSNLIIQYSRGIKRFHRSDLIQYHITHRVLDIDIDT